MDFKKLIHRFRGKIPFETSFLVILAVVMVVSFFILRFLILFLIHSIENKKYDVTIFDEKAVYEGIDHNIKDDFSLVIQAEDSYLNGDKIQQNISRNQPIAVVIENYTPIRDQQTGLEDAAIVYETPAEGGITRFLAIYDGRPVESIGPVRSARPYFITWASELRAAFVHVGGSPDALTNLKNNFRLFNIDEFSDYITIWRNNKYLAPHNAFTSIGKITERLSKAKYHYPLKTSRFILKEDDTPGDIQNITIDFSITPYGVKYVYDPTDNKYTRYNGGKLHHEIKPKNILVQFVDKEVLDSEGRLRIQTHGTGNTLVFRDGKVIEGTWEKDSSINSEDQAISESWTKFFDKEGNEIELNRGQVWIEVVPNDRPVNYF